LVSFLAKKNNGLLGIDISSSSIKLLELSKSGSKYKVECYASRPLPDGSVVEKNIANLDAVGETMLKLASLVDASTDKAAVAVSGSAVITKSIAMNAALTDSEMETQIALEADQYIPYPLDEVLIDFERQGLSEKDPEMVQLQVRQILAPDRKFLQVVRGISVLLIFVVMRKVLVRLLLILPMITLLEI
jgi:type IV pilus assembly protein PilM